jgi:hypothetical protein
MERLNMSSRNRSEELLDIRLQHTLKNWAAHTPAPKEGREQLLAAVVQQKALQSSNHLLKQKITRLFHAKTSLSERSVFPGYVSALDSVYAIKASMTVA